MEGAEEESFLLHRLTSLRAKILCFEQIIKKNAVFCVICLIMSEDLCKFAARKRTNTKNVRT